MQDKSQPPLLAVPSAVAEMSKHWILNLDLLSLRYDPPVSSRPWWFQRGCLRSGQPSPVAPSRGGSMAHGSTLPVPHSTSLWPAAALPWRTRGRKRRKPAQWWVVHTNEIKMNNIIYVLTCILCSTQPGFITYLLRSYYEMNVWLSSSS